MIRYAIFDMDGTTLDTSGMWAALPERYLARLGIAADRAELAERLHSLSLTEGAAFLRERFGIAYSVEEILRQVNGMTEQFYREEAPLRDGIPRLLSELRCHGVRMSIATAGDRELCLAALSRHGVDGYFEGIATCSEYGAKTAPEVFLAAAGIIGAVPAETLVFEDSLFAVRTAAAAGFVTAAVRDISEENQAALRAESDFYALSPEEYCGRVAELLGAESRRN